MVKISVVVPLYNAEAYLEECLNSIIRQTFKDLEIILVNDGSTDGSAKICDDYAALDSRIKVIHNTNNGLGVTYNTGIDAATGEYIGFVESDDFINENMYEDLYALASKYDADIVKSEWFNYFTSTNYREKNGQLSWANSYEVLNPKDHPTLLHPQSSVWSAIYKRDWMLNNNVRFLETPGASYQDVAFTFKAFTKANSMVVTPNAYLYYRKDNDNASIKSKGKVRAIFDEYEEVDKFFKQNPDLKDVFWTSKLIKQYADFHWNLQRVDIAYKKEFLEEFSAVFNNYNINNDLTEDFVFAINREELRDIMVDPDLFLKNYMEQFAN